MTMADERPIGNIPRRDDRASDVSPPDTMEAKRLEARRRFLLGGAAALPVFLHVTATSAAHQPDNVGGSGFCSPDRIFREFADQHIPGNITLFICE